MQGLDDPLSHVDGACKHCGGKLVILATPISPAGRTKVIPTIPVFANQGTSAVALTDVVTLLWIFEECLAISCNLPHEKINPFYNLH